MNMNESHSHLKAGLLAAFVAAIGLSASAQTNQPSRTGPKSFTNFSIITERNIFFNDTATTEIYTHVTRELRDAAIDPINELMLNA